MIAGGEVRDEATSKKMGILCTKLKSSIGFWNVRAICDIGKIEQVTSDMGRTAWISSA